MTATAPTGPAKVVAMTIPVSRIDRDPNQPREHFDEAKLQELAQSMKALGQLQPITVRTPDVDPKGRDNAARRYTIVMGERRWRAAQIAGITKMRCLVEFGIEDGDRETLAKAVAENVGRADMTPMEEANGFDRLVKLGYSTAEVGTMCGKSEQYVLWRIDLLRLAPEVQEALAKGHLPVGLAWFVANLSADNQRRFLTRWARGDFASIRDGEAFAQACRAEEERVANQGSFFVLSEGTEDPARTAGTSPDGLFGPIDLPSEERERIAADRRKLVSKIERLGTAGAILSEIAAMDAGELALLLAGAQGGVHAHRVRVDHLKDVAFKAVKKLREAQAVAAVRAGSLQVDPEAVADSSAA